MKPLNSSGEISPRPLKRVISGLLRADSFARISSLWASFWAYQMGEVIGGPEFTSHRETFEYLAHLGFPVNPELRVRGTEGLRVVDASVFPDMLGGNINAPTIMFAERVADLMRGRAPLAPMNVPPEGVAA